MKLSQKLLAVQSSIEKIGKNAKNPFFKSNYVDLNDIIDVLKPELEKNEILLTIPLTNVNGLPAIKLSIQDASDEGEEFIEETFLLPNLVDPQKMGSAVTYYRRYMLMSFFNLKAEDDDGHQASQASKRKTGIIQPKESFSL